MKKVLYISLLLLLPGCGSTLKNSWTNFQAYYNSYYNAERNYASGLDKVESQQVEIDVDEPIRIHPHPLQAGGQDFQKAIDKGADILRKFPESKWIDETLELIGKSYYYRQEYYSALQKFEEQYRVTDSPLMRQRAVIWKGRVLLDLDLNDEGITYLQNELTGLDGEWQSELRGEATVLLAEHHVGLREWTEVEERLREAIPDLNKGPMKARSFFLLGQILEARERYGEASYAYSQCVVNRPDFELLYWTNLKQAEVLRKMDDLDSATLIYEKMIRDDKNIRRLAEIRYELARTEEQRRHFPSAERAYKRILRSNTAAVPPKVRADIYYRLGEIYAREYNRIETAAAYYDSSSTYAGSSDSGIFAEPSKTDILARAYGTYSELKKRIDRLDSLLWLGSLPKARFDSVIAAVRNRKLLERQTTGRRDERNAMVMYENRSPAGLAGDNESGSGMYGFLNHRSSGLLAEGEQQFRALWGDRRLADNWRRIEVLRSDAEREGQPNRQDRTSTIQDTAAGGVNRILVDISEVPFTEREKQRLRDEVAVAKYELGSLFLLTLEEPDSAASYFTQVVEAHSGHPVVPKAIYSLYEAYSSLHRTEEALRRAEQLRRNYPNSIYTRRLNERMGRAALNAPADEERHLAGRMSAIMDSLSSDGEIARELRNLALANKEATVAHRIHFEAIKHYIRLAREREPSVDSTESLPESRKRRSYSPRYAYSGSYWDTVRLMLHEYRQHFPIQSPTGDKVMRLSEELEKSVGETRTYQSCKELGITPEIKTGMKGFLATVGLPEDTEALQADTVAYEMVIEKTGKVLSFELMSDQTGTGVKNAFDQAIENNLEFVPFRIPDSAESVRCLISFPLRR